MGTGVTRNSRSPGYPRSFGILAIAAVLSLWWVAVPASSQGAFRPSLSELDRDKGVMFTSGCLTGGDMTESGECVFGDPDSSRTVVLFGDSHAMQWGPALIRLAERRDWRIVALLRASCPAADVALDANCDLWRQNSLRRIRDLKPGLTLVSTATGSFYREVGSNLVDGMARTLRRLRSFSKRTVVIRDHSVVPFTVPDCLAKNRRRPARCSFTLNRDRLRSYDKKAADRVRGVGLIDPLPMLCPGGLCPAVDREVVIYRKYGHMSATFIETKWRWLARKLGVGWSGPG